MTPARGSSPSARRVAYDALRRIEADGAYANLVLGKMLERSGLAQNDRRFVTDLVYGTTRMRRACDALCDRFVTSPPDPATRTLLRLGAYQLEFAGVAPHAAVGETVALAPKRVRGFVNAVLRKVSTVDMVWPSDLARLSYPDWIGDALRAELGDDAAMRTLARMNEPATVTTRDDGYTQDAASQWVSAAVGASPGERVLDACAAPGGKATALAATGAWVTAADVRPARTRLIVENAMLTGVEVATVIADASKPPFRAATFDAVLIDAPCSGLGALRRRPDARWRIQQADIPRLVALQRRILAASGALVRPGGRLVYSVCTLTAAESVDHPTPAGFEIDETAPPDGIWQRFGPGWRVLPHEADTDGMILVRYRRTS